MEEYIREIDKLNEKIKMISKEHAEVLGKKLIESSTLEENNTEIQELRFKLEQITNEKRLLVEDLSNSSAKVNELTIKNQSLDSNIKTLNKMLKTLEYNYKRLDSYTNKLKQEIFTNYKHDENFINISKEFKQLSTVQSRKESDDIKSVKSSSSKHEILISDDLKHHNSEKI